MTKSTSSSTPASAPAIKRRRGRPRKYPLPTPTVTPIDAEIVANKAVAEAPAGASLEQLEAAITRALRATLDAASAKLPVVEVMLMTTKQAAEALSVSEGTIWNLIGDGRLNAIKIAGTRRVPMDEIRRLAAVGTSN